MNDDAIDWALHVWREEAEVAYMARINDHLRPDGTPDLEALRKADDEAEQKNRNLMRRAVLAALAKSELMKLATAWDARANGNISVADPYEYLEKLAYRDCAKQLGAIIGKPEKGLPDNTLQE